MKVNVSVEATAQEMREFLGLGRNVQPLHDDLLQVVRDNMQRGAVNFDALNLLKPLLPAPFTSMDRCRSSGKRLPRAVLHLVATVSSARRITCRMPATLLQRATAQKNHHNNRPRRNLMNQTR